MFPSFSCSDPVTALESLQPGLAGRKFCKECFIWYCVAIALWDQHLLPLVYVWTMLPAAVPDPVGLGTVNLGR